VVKYSKLEEITNAFIDFAKDKKLNFWVNSKWKLELIEKMNPEWKDLYYDLV